MRLSIENFGLGDYSAFVYGNGGTSIVNNPLIYNEDVVDQFNVAVSGSSDVKSQLVNLWPLSAFTLSATAVPGMKFINNNESPMSALMFNSFGVGLTNEISSTPYRVTTYSHATSSYTEYSTQPDDHYVAIYKPVANIVDIEDYVPFAVAGPINYNYIVEFSLQNSQYRSDYVLGVTFVNAFHTKNMYNQLYNTETTINTNYSVINSITLDNCRKYNYIGSNSKEVFLVYTFGKKYTGSSTVSADTNYHTTRDVITEYPISATTYTAPNTASQYEYIERIKGVGAWEGGLEGKHKTNLFSVKILNSRLNESITDTATRAKIQNSINIVLRRLISEFIPAHTELFNIYWEGR